jgi:hypothetical protein
LVIRRFIPYVPDSQQKKRSLLPVKERSLPSNRFSQAIGNTGGSTQVKVQWQKIPTSLEHMMQSLVVTRHP